MEDLHSRYQLKNEDLSQLLGPGDSPYLWDLMHNSLSDFNEVSRFVSSLSGSDRSQTDSHWSSSKETFNARNDKVEE